MKLSKVRQIAMKLFLGWLALCVVVMLASEAFGKPAATIGLIFIVGYSVADFTFLYQNNRCPICHKFLRYNSSFCPNCGANLDQFD